MRSKNIKLIETVIRKILYESQTNDKIKIVVGDEVALGYIDPRSPNMVSILNSLGTKTAISSNNGPVHKSRFNKIRLAKSSDFEKFRVLETGYMNDDNYEYTRQ